MPLFSIGQTGKSSFVTAQRHLNLFAEPTVDGDKNVLAFYGTPGYSLFTDDNGDTPIRGWITAGDLLYFVHRGTFYQINNAGVRTSRGTLNTVSGRVDLAYDGSVILIVDGTNGYTYTVATTTFAQIADADFPDGANTCDWLDGQFVVDNGDGSDSFFVSADGTTWDALDFASAESAPDGLVRLFVDHGEILLLGEGTTEFWGNLGGSDFPFAPVKGSTAEIGLAARWSLVKFDSGIAFLGKSRQGQVQVYRMDGYVPRVISTPEVGSEINGYSTVSDATAISYMDRGHPILILNFPTAGKSWQYDALSGMWSPRESGLSGGRYRGELGIDFQNETRIADYSNGNIYTLDPDLFEENGTAIASEIITRHLFRDNKRVTIDELYVDMEVGVGLATGQGSDPQVMLQVSKNNGKTWGTELWKSIGKIGEYATRVRWRRLGEGYDWLFKLRITDPVKRVFIFTDIETEAEK